MMVHLTELIAGLAEHLPLDSDSEGDWTMPSVIAETRNRRYTIEGIERRDVPGQAPHVIIRLEWVD